MKQISFTQEARAISKLPRNLVRVYQNCIVNSVSLKYLFLIAISIFSTFTCNLISKKSYNKNSNTFPLIKQPRPLQLVASYHSNLFEDLFKRTLIQVTRAYTSNLWRLQGACRWLSCKWLKSL